MSSLIHVCSFLGYTRAKPNPTCLMSVPSFSCMASCSTDPHFHAHEYNVLHKEFKGIAKAQCHLLYTLAAVLLPHRQSLLLKASEAECEKISSCPARYMCWYKQCVKEGCYPRGVELITNHSCSRIICMTTIERCVLVQ